ncbi:hypothetical protein [Streptomyces sp. 142MFCol3.1]|uniref:hypothetical protein n=1 Tax=Streptomyces sp. 142MFCol3.1 TaxID=1172179 RepID=UPI00131A0748|nr:hypothetical protein [Streptomyces sp. 142MFCol3.1]
MLNGSRTSSRTSPGASAKALVWDVQDSEWISDCPVLLDFTGEQVEINHAKFDDLSIAWNT